MFIISSCLQILLEIGGCLKLHVQPGNSVTTYFDMHVRKIFRPTWDIYAPIIKLAYMTTP